MLKDWDDYYPARLNGKQKSDVRDGCQMDRWRSFALFCGFRFSYSGWHDEIAAFICDRTAFNRDRLAEDDSRLARSRWRSLSE